MEKIININLHKCVDILDENKRIIHKFYKNLVNDDMDNIVNLRNIDNYNKALNIVKKYTYIKDVSDLTITDNIKYLSAKNLCNIGFKLKYKFNKIELNNNKKYLVLFSNNIYNKVRILLDDKIVLFKEVK